MITSAMSINNACLVWCRRQLCWLSFYVTCSFILFGNYFFLFCWNWHLSCFARFVAYYWGTQVLWEGTRWHGLTRLYWSTCLWTEVHWCCYWWYGCPVVICVDKTAIIASMLLLVITLIFPSLLMTCNMLLCIEGHQVIDWTEYSTISVWFVLHATNLLQWVSFFLRKSQKDLCIIALRRKVTTLGFRRDCPINRIAEISGKLLFILTSESFLSYHYIKWLLLVKRG